MRGFRTLGVLGFSATIAAQEPTPTLRNRSRLIVPAIVGLALGLAGEARAESLTFTRIIQADYELSLLGGTPLNPGETTPFIAFRAVGELTFVLGSEIHDPGASEVPFQSVTGLLTGVSPTPAAFLPHTLDPNVEFLGGRLTNIIRDADGTILAADVDDLQMRWQLIAPGLRLLTTVGLPFFGPVGGVPFSVGDVIAEADPFEVYLDTGTSLVLIGTGRNRTLTVVPEPHSVVLLGLGAICVGVGGVIARHGGSASRSCAPKRFQERAGSIGRPGDQCA